MQQHWKSHRHRMHHQHIAMYDMRSTGFHSSSIRTSNRQTSDSFTPKTRSKPGTSGVCRVCTAGRFWVADGVVCHRAIQVGGDREWCLFACVLVTDAGLAAMASEYGEGTCGDWTRSEVGESRLSLRCIECRLPILLRALHYADCPRCGGMLCQRSVCSWMHHGLRAAWGAARAQGRRQKLCQICRAHRPRRRRTCRLCAWKAGPGCEPQRCWIPQARCCRWCLEERLLKGLPKLAIQMVEVCLALGWGGSEVTTSREQGHVARTGRLGTLAAGG